MAFPLDRSSYVKVGADKGLEFLDELAPATVYDKCNWRCTLCGLSYYKTYRAVYLGKHGCRCQNGMSMPVEKYQELEKKFNIKLLAKANNFLHPSEWFSPATGKTVMVSYYQLVNAPYKHRELLRELGIEIEDRETRANSDYNDPVRIAKLKKKQLEDISKFRLPNQEEEKGLIEIYD